MFFWGSSYFGSFSIDWVAFVETEERNGQCYDQARIGVQEKEYTHLIFFDFAFKPGEVFMKIAINVLIVTTIYATLLTQDISASCVNTQQLNNASATMSVYVDRYRRFQLKHAGDETSFANYLSATGCSLSDIVMDFQSAYGSGGEKVFIPDQSWVYTTIDGYQCYFFQTSCGDIITSCDNRDYVFQLLDTSFPDHFTLTTGTTYECTQRNECSILLQMEGEAYNLSMNYLNIEGTLPDGLEFISNGNGEAQITGVTELYGSFDLTIQGSSHELDGHHRFLLSEKFTVTLNIAQGPCRISGDSVGNGHIYPELPILVELYGTQQLQFVPDEGYHIKTITIDGTPTAIDSVYTFSSIEEDHTVAAEFLINSYEINASAGVGGEITPNGISVFEHGATANYQISIANGYDIERVTIDGVSVSPQLNYSLIVTEPHTIDVQFKESPDVHHITSTVEIPPVEEGLFYGHAIYENNLTIWDTGNIVSRGTSQMIIEVRGTLTIKPGGTIRSRNGYYKMAPSIFLATLSDEALAQLAVPYEGINLYPNLYGKGGNGASGEDGTNGSSQAYLYGNGGDGGGGGGGGFGGGLGGAGGSGGIGYVPASNGSNGASGSNNGGDGGSSGTGYAGGIGGGDLSVGGKGAFGSFRGAAGSGGGGNGGEGGSRYGGCDSYCVDGTGGPGGGGGGYGGGVLTIIASKIVIENTDSPSLLVSGQMGGGGPLRKGEDGQGGLLIIRSQGYSSDEAHWNSNSTSVPGLNNTSHGVVLGNPQKVLVVIDKDGDRDSLFCFPVKTQQGNISIICF